MLLNCLPSTKCKTIRVTRISKYALEKLNNLGYVVIIVGGARV